MSGKGRVTARQILAGWAGNQSAGLLMLAALIVMWLLRPVFPAGVWFLPFVFSAYCLWTVWREIGTPSQKLVGRVALLCAAGHVLALLLSASYDPAQMTWWRDDHYYHGESVALAKAWRVGFYPDISLKGAPPYMGTLHTGYQRALAAIFYLSPGNLGAARMLNVASGALLPVLSALLSYLLFCRGQLLPNRSYRSPIVIAALLASLHPAQFYYTQFLLKDVYHTAWFLTAAVLIIAAIVHKSLAGAVAGAAALYMLYTIRAYAAFSLGAGACAFLILHLPLRIALNALACGVVGLTLLLRYTDFAAAQGAQLLHSLVELAPRHATSAGGVVRHFLSGLPRLLLAPFSWIYALGDRPLYSLYPGMWFLYLLVYPPMFTGIGRAVRQNIRQAVVPLMGLLGGSFILLIATYGGDAPRQRFYLEYIAIAFAAGGWANPHRRAFLVWYGLLFLYASGQVISVKMRGL